MKRLIPMIAVAACAVTAFAEKSEKDTFDSSDLSAWWINPSEDTKVDTENNWLDINTDKDHVVQRLYNDGQDISGNPYPEKILSNGMLYFDSRVKFTISDSLSFEGGADAKIGLWAYSKDDGEPTNLVVCAGVKNGTGIGKEIFLTTTEIKADTFYRVTVKAMPIGSDKYGFGIYVDGVPVVIDTTADTETFAVATGFELSDLNATAQSYEKINALFPSLIDGTGYDELTAVGFIGTGIVDDVDFTDELPEDIPGDATTQAFAWTGNFESIKVETDGGEKFQLDLSSTSQNLEFKAGTKTFTIEAVPADGYAIVGSTVGEKNVGDKIKIEAYEIAFTVDGVPYQNLTEALAAATATQGAVLKLFDDIEPFSFAGDLFLDLNGHNISAGYDGSITIDSGSLTITNSQVGVGGIVAAGTSEIGASIYTEAVTCPVTIYDGQYAGAIYGNPVTLYPGVKFVDYDPNDETITIVDGYEATFDESTGYWTITKKETKNFIIEIVDGDKYESFAEALANAKDGDTLKLLGDVTGDGVKIDKSITVDFGGFIYTVNAELVGSPNTKSQAFNLVQGKTITLKNGTITSTVARMLVQNYASLTLDNMVLDGENLAAKNGNGNDYVAYTLSNCDGDTVIKGNTVIKARVLAGQTSFAFDTYYKAGEYEDATVTVNGATIDGDVELAGGSLTLTAGTLNGALVAGSNIEKGTVTKDDSFTAPAPEGYIWDNGTLVAIQEVTPVVAIDDPIVKYVDDMQFPTVNVEGYTLTTDYTVAWAPNAITEPTAGTTNTYTATVTMTGKYTGTGTATLQVYKEAEQPTPVIDPVVPGADIEIPAGAVAEEFAETVEAQKDTLLKAPGEVATTDTYRSYFTAAVVGDKVEFVLNKDGEAAIQANANGEIVKIKPNEIAALTTEEGKFEVATTIPGFYYAVKQGNGIGNMKVVEEGVLAKDAEGVELTFKKYQGAGFYQIIVSEKPIPAAAQ